MNTGDVQTRFANFVPPLAMSSSTPTDAFQLVHKPCWEPAHASAASAAAKSVTWRGSGDPLQLPWEVEAQGFLSCHQFAGWCW